MFVRTITKERRLDGIYVPVNITNRADPAQLPLRSTFYSGYSSRSRVTAQ
jgi:hypothetical protein